MKKLLTILVVSAFALFLMPAKSMAQCDQTILTTCFEGACGNTDPVSVTLTEGGNYSLAVGISLCGAGGARVSVTVNHRKYNRILQSGESIDFSAAAGDVVTIDATGWQIDPNIICVWAGQIDATLCKNL